MRMTLEGLGTRLVFARYLDSLVNAEALAETLPSVTREVWLFALRARVLLVVNMSVVLLDVKNVEITASRISVCVRDLCAALAVHLGETLRFSWMAFGCTGSMH